MQADFRIEFVDDDWDVRGRIDALNWAVLYREFGVDPNDDWHQASEHSIYAVALSGRHALLGSVRLTGQPGEADRQLRQLAVEPLLHGQGVGRALVRACEQRASEEGAVLLWFNARDTAYGFYERLGYERVGEEFVSTLTRIPHTRMQKRL